MAVGQSPFEGTVPVPKLARKVPAFYGRFNNAFTKARHVFISSATPNKFMHSSHLFKIHF